MLILPFNGVYPRIHRSAWIAPNATIIGDVEIGPDSSVFYGCVLRADVGAIRLGARVNIQDNSVIHEEADVACVLEDDVTVGHMAMLHGTHVGAGTLVGMKATLLSRSVVGPGSLIAAGALVMEGQEISQRSPSPPASRRRFAANSAMSNRIPLSLTPDATLIYPRHRRFPTPPFPSRTSTTTRGR